MDTLKENTLISNENIFENLQDISFTDIFDINYIQQMQDLFSDAHGVASLITDINGNPITKPSNFTFLCENIIRKTELGCINCFKSDALIGNYNPKGANVQQCLSGGLWDAGASIAVGGRHIANWLIGQVRNDAIDINKMMQYADEIGADKHAFLEAYNNVPEMSVEKFTKVANLLFYIANELSEKGFSNLQLKKQIAKSEIAHKLLIKSEEDFRNLIELSPVAMVVIHEWKTIYFNPAALQLFGAKTLSEVVNRNILDFVHPEGHDLVSKNAQTIKSKGLIPKQEQKHIKLDGTILEVETQSKSIIFNSQPATLVVINDISERKRNEYKTQLNTKRLNALVDVLQYSTDSIQDYLDYALSKIIEITESKIGYIYHYYEDRKEFVLNSWSKEVMSECLITERKTIYQLEKTGIWGEAVRQRKAIIVNNFQAFHPLKKGYPEGHAPLYRYLTIPVFYNKEIVGVVAVANKEIDYVEEDVIQLTILMDIVWKSLEKKKADIALQISEDKFKNLFYSSPDGITITRLNDGKFFLVNPSFTEIFGYEENEIIGLESTEINIWFDIDDRKKMVEQLMKNGEVKNFESIFITKSGNIIYCLISASIIELNDEKWILSQTRDITSRKTTENALIKKNADLDFMNKFMVNREVRMAEMKREINELLESMGQEKRYL